MDTINIDVAQSFIHVRDDIAEAAYKAGRKPSDIRLVAVTKFVEQQRILPAITAGCTEVGENRAQEITEKFDFFTAHNQTIHFIGQLQLNKVKYLVGRAALIQSADRDEVFCEINRLACKQGIVQNTLVEVNIGDEPQKSGIEPAALPELLKRISDMSGIRVNGLMCVPPAVGESNTRPFFARMRELFYNMGQSNLPNVSMDVLSMGMSGDYRAAVAEGATMVRVGSAIFGARQRRQP